MTDAAKDPKFRGLMRTFAELWRRGYRGRVTVDIDGKGAVWVRLETGGIQITEETVPKIVLLSSDVA